MLSEPRRAGTDPPLKRLAVLGAGTMGAGIAQLGVQVGCRTTLVDPDAGALETGRRRLESGLDRLVAKDVVSDEDRRQMLDGCQFVQELGEIAEAEFVIEAAPERLALKLELFAAVGELVSDDCVLATNTSSFSVTEIAAACSHPERVVGMHFFNPAPVMRLVEVVAGEQTAGSVVRCASRLGEAMGKRVISAADIAGFLVNRCNRPFSLEALRLLEQGIASVDQIDRIARRHGGFRMGPFELMDLVGIDTNHAVAESFLRQSYGEPRFRPSPLAARKVAAGTLGRKTGRGWYEYRDDKPPADEGWEPPIAQLEFARAVLICGESGLASELRTRAHEAGWDVVSADDRRRPDLVLDCDGTRPGETDVPTAVLLERGSLHRLNPSAVGFYLVLPLDGVRLVEITTTARSDPGAVAEMTLLAHSLGWEVERVGDGPGLVLGRIVAQLVNEAAFVLGEGNGSPSDIDDGMRLGVNHPRGPVEWCSIIGSAAVLRLLDALHLELGEERYRAAPLLRQCVAVGADLTYLAR